MDTLNTPQPQSSRNRFAQQYTTKSVYGTFAKEPDHLLDAQAANTSKPVYTKRPAANKPATNGNHLPPSKRPRTGASPMQGRSKHDAISLEDSEDPIALNDDFIEVSPGPATQSTQLRCQSLSANIGPQRVSRSVQSSTAPKAHDGSADDRAGDHELKILQSPIIQRPDSSHSAHQAIVDLDMYADEDDEDSGEQFTKNAARQRKAQQGSPSPEPGRRKLAKQVVKSPVNPPFQPHASFSGYLREGEQRGKESQTRYVQPSNGSQSPDELHSGITTQDVRQSTPYSISRPTKRLDAMSGSDLAQTISKHFVGNPRSTILSRNPQKSKQQPQQSRPFDIYDAHYHVLAELPKEHIKALCLIVDYKEQGFYLTYKDSGFGKPDDATAAITVLHSIRNIDQIRHGNKSPFLHIKFKGQGGGRSQAPMALDLGSDMQALDVIKAFQEIDIDFNIIPESDARMIQYFEKVRADAPEYARSSSRAINEAHQLHQSGLVKSGRRSETSIGAGDTQAPNNHVNGTTTTSRKPTVISHIDRQLALEMTSAYFPNTRASRSQRTIQENSKSTKLESPYFDPAQIQARTLRSTPRRKAKSPSPPPKPKFSSTGGLGEEWKKPLVYPQGGQRRESVGFGDLWRLDGDEFLNDTLIGFFLRYVQGQTELQRPQDLKKMHFFNSYFFDSLNKGTKNVKTINYESVKRWTTKFDIFSRDFVIVPVNENVHWFVAIICNLPKLRPNKEDEDEDEEDVEAVATTVTIEDELEDTGEQGQRTKETQESFEELKIVDTDLPTSSTITDSQNHNTPTPKKPGRKAKKKGRHSLPKYDTGQPIIITLDSLGLARGNVAATLKQYIVQEAKHKKNWDISESGIKAMTAKSIPMQNNYSDCGLYMCMYLEQFMCDPYGFVEKILQRHEDQIRWPLNISSDDLRKNMRNWLLELHRRQEGEEEKMPAVPDMGKILVQMRGPGPEAELVEESPEPEGPPLPTRSRGPTPMMQQAVHHIPGLDYEDDDDDGFLSEADPIPVSSNTQKELAAKAIQQINDSADVILIEDDGSPVKDKKHNLRSSPRRSNHHGPSELAQSLRTKREALPTTAAKATSPPKEQQGARSASVSTDFMHGIDGFAQDYDDEQAKIESLRENAITPAPDDELANEIAETQQNDSGEKEVEEGERQNSWIPPLGVEKKERVQEHEEMLV